MSSSDKAKQSLIPYYGSNFKEPALTDEEAALVLLQMQTGIVPLPPSRQSGHGAGSWSQEPVHGGNISGMATDLKKSALTVEKLALVIRQMRMCIVREYESRSQSHKPMHDGNISGAAYDPDFKGPALTDEEAALTLLHMRSGINLVPASNHLQRKCGSQSRKPMHDNSAGRISDTTSREPKNATPSQSIDYGSDVTTSAAPSNAEYSGSDETNSAAFNGLDLDGEISDTASGMGFYGAGGINSPERVGHHSDAKISDPELNKNQFVGERTSNIVDNDSDATISDPELEDKYQYVHHNSGSLMVTDHDPNEPISILQPNTDDSPESSTAAAQSKVKRTKKTASKNDLDIRSERRCRLCHEPGHNCKDCPTIPCTYEGCNEIGHVKSYCPKRLKKVHKYKSDRQTAYVSRKRRAASADQDSIMTYKRNKHSEK